MFVSHCAAFPFVGSCMHESYLSTYRFELSCPRLPQSEASHSMEVLFLVLFPLVTLLISSLRPGFAACPSIVLWVESEADWPMELEQSQPGSRSMQAMANKEVGTGASHWIVAAAKAFLTVEDADCQLVLQAQGFRLSRAGCLLLTCTGST